MSSKRQDAQESATATAFSRRRLLGGAARIAAAAAAQSLMPLHVQKMLAMGETKGASLNDIKHVVMLMQENRSFDHYYGTLPGVRGFNDEKAIKLASTDKSVFHQPDRHHPDGHMLPFHLNTRTTSAQKIPSTSHAWAVQHEAWNHGKMDRWMPAHRNADGDNGPFCMGYYTREDIPFQFALAESFTICDGYFSSVMGPTWPNRMYWMTGTVDAEGKHGGPMIDNYAPPGGFTWKTYPERLQEAGIPWKVYQEEDNYSCNMLEKFRTFQNAPVGSPIYKRGMMRGQIGEFEYDALNDKLPPVSWIIPTSHQSEHPDFMPADGAAFVASKIDAIAANPDVWAKTLFILNYDENDGLFDHVPPPTPPAGTPNEYILGLPIGGGFRVPCVLISPWTVGGWAYSDPLDHSSVLMFLEKFTGVREPNISNWRRRTFGDFMSALRFRDGRQVAPKLPDTTAPRMLAEFEAKFLPRPKVPPAVQKMPEIEQGEGGVKSVPLEDEVV